MPLSAVRRRTAASLDALLMSFIGRGTGVIEVRKAICVVFSLCFKSDPALGSAHFGSARFGSVQFDSVRLGSVGLG